MKKRIIAIATLMMMAVVPAMSQVFLDDEEMNSNRDGNRGLGPGAYIPQQNDSNDQYAPVGEGILLLAGLAGAYLIGKRRKEE